MGGHPIWALEENRPRMMRLVNYVKNYNRAVEGNERFHGIHLDIEPYVACMEGKFARLFPNGPRIWMLLLRN